MKRLSRLIACPITCGAFLLSSTGFAQIGLVRQQVDEYSIQRQQQNASRGDADASARITKPGDYTFTIQHGGLRRTYRVHVPTTYDPATPAPLLLAFHGGGGNMDLQANDSYYGQITKSDHEGFVAVFPNGFSKLKSGKLATWNAGNCCGAARDKNVDDVGFVRRIVANITHQMSIDRSRIFATGMSNGAMMSYRLACEMPDVFKAIAAVAGTDNTLECKPRNPVSVLHIHARDDTHVLFDGGAGPGTRDQSQVTDFTSVADTIAKWVRLSGCAATPQRNLDTAGAYCEVYSSCRANAAIQLCVTETGGHSWPRGVKPRGGEPPSKAISANDVMWEFFKRR